jgi:hypothetical protein
MEFFSGGREKIAKKDLQPVKLERNPLQNND